MAGGIFGLIADNWVTYVFGSPMIAALVIILAFLMFGMYAGWSIEVHIAVLVPLTSILALVILDSWVFAILLMGMGAIIGFALLKVLRG